MGEKKKKYTGYENDGYYPLASYADSSRQKLGDFDKLSGPEKSLLQLMMMAGYKTPEPKFFSQEYDPQGGTLGYRKKGDNENIYLNAPDAQNPFGRFSPSIIPDGKGGTLAKTLSSRDSMETMAHEMTHFYDPDTSVARGNGDDYWNHPTERRARNGEPYLQDATMSFMNGDTSSALKQLLRWRDISKLKGPGQ